MVQVIPGQLKNAVTGHQKNMLQALKTLRHQNERVLSMKEFSRYLQFRRTKHQTVRHEIVLGRPRLDTFLLSSLVHGGWTYSGTFVCPVTNLSFHKDVYLQRNLVTRYAMLRKSHTISKLGLRANKGMEQRRLGSSLKSRMGTRPLKFFWVTTSRVPML